MSVKVSIRVEVAVVGGGCGRGGVVLWRGSGMDAPFAADRGCSQDRKRA